MKTLYKVKVEFANAPFIFEREFILNSKKEIDTLRDALSALFPDQYDIKVRYDGLDHIMAVGDIVNEIRADAEHKFWTVS